MIVERFIKYSFVPLNLSEFFYSRICQTCLRYKKNVIHPSSSGRQCNLTATCFSLLNEKRQVIVLCHTCCMLACVRDKIMHVLSRDFHAGVLKARITVTSS